MFHQREFSGGTGSQNAMVKTSSKANAAHTTQRTVMARARCMVASHCSPQTAPAA